MNQKDFLNWCRSVNSNPTDKPPQVSTEPYLKNRSNWPSDFVNSVLEQLNSGNKPMVVIKDDISGDCIIESSESGPDKYIEHLSIETTVRNLTLNNLWLKGIRIIYGHKINLTINNCNIGSILFEGNSSRDGYSKSQITGTSIGHLIVRENSIIELTVKGGSILGIDCPVPGARSPFKGSVLFQNVSFPKKIVDGFIVDAQPYRNMRHHLRTLENGPMVDLFHNLELRIDEETDSKLSNKFFSRLYRELSNYGSSISRPLIIAFYALVITACSVYFSNGAILASQDKSNYVGVASFLYEGDCNKIYQALYLAGRPIINPLGLFKDFGSLVKPSSMPIAVLIWFENLLIYVLIALFIFALRRRFKIPS